MRYKVIVIVVIFLTTVLSGNAFPQKNTQVDWQVKINEQQKIVQESENKYGANDIKTIQAMDALAIFYMRSEQLEDAKEIFIAAAKRAEGDEGKDIYASNFDRYLIDIFSRLDEMEEGIEHFERRHTYLEKQYGSESTFAINAKIDLTIMYFIAQNWKKAELYSMSVIEKLEKTMPQSAWVSTHYFRLGIAQKKLGKLEASRKSLERAVNLASKHPSYKNLEEEAKKALEDLSGEQRKAGDRFDQTPKWR